MCINVLGSQRSNEGISGDLQLTVKMRGGVESLIQRISSANSWGNTCSQFKGVPGCDL
jgi:hypothetical protein